MKQTVLITGASRGIGAAAAKRFAQDGCRLILNYQKNEEKIRALRESLKTEVLLCRADISKARDVEHMVQKALNAFGKIDVLINNAGIAEQMCIRDRTLRVNNLLKALPCVLLNHQVGVTEIHSQCFCQNNTDGAFSRTRHTDQYHIHCLTSICQA